MHNSLVISHNLYSVCMHAVWPINLPKLPNHLIVDIPGTTKYSWDILYVRERGALYETILSVISCRLHERHDITSNRSICYHFIFLYFFYLIHYFISFIISSCLLYFSELFSGLYTRKSACVCVVTCQTRVFNVIFVRVTSKTRDIRVADRSSCNLQHVIVISEFKLTFC